MIKLTEKNKALTLSQKMMKGDEGGHYIPSIDENGNLTWTPSDEDMSPVEGANIKGPRGDTGVYIGNNPPDDENISVWVNPEGESTAELATKAYVDEKILGIEVNVDTSNFYTKAEVDEQINSIELTPGPKGDTGEPGFTPVKGLDYWTDEDKAAIVSDVLTALPAAEGVKV